MGKIDPNIQIEPATQRMTVLGGTYTLEEFYAYLKDQWKVLPAAVLYCDDEPVAQMWLSDAKTYEFSDGFSDNITLSDSWNITPEFQRLIYEGAINS